MLVSVLIVLLKRKLVVCGGVEGGGDVLLELKVFVAKANGALGCDEDIKEKNASAKLAGSQMSTF